MYPFWDEVSHLQGLNPLSRLSSRPGSLVRQGSWGEKLWRKVSNGLPTTKKSSSGLSGWKACSIYYFWRSQGSCQSAEIASNFDCSARQRSNDMAARTSSQLCIANLSILLSSPLTSVKLFRTTFWSVQAPHAACREKIINGQMMLSWRSWANFKLH